MLGNRLHGDPAYFATDSDPSCFDVPQEDLFSGDDLAFSNTLLGITPVCTNSEGGPIAWFNVM